MARFRMTFSNATRKRAFKCDKAHTQRSDKQWVGTGNSQFFHAKPDIYFTRNGADQGHGKGAGQSNQAGYRSEKPGSV